MKNFNTTYKTIFNQYYPQMLFYATRIVGDEDAEDVVQDAFVELWKRHEKLDEDEHIRAFLFHAIYTRSLNVLKHRSIKQDYSDSVQDIELRKAQFYQPDNNEAINRIENKELHDEIFAAINELPEKCREVFMLSYLEGMKNKEIADVMNISIKTVEVHMYKALKYLRGRLDYLMFVSLIFMING
jgi:RNA polymerase sigma-70 factor (ECF subfamily)